MENNGFERFSNAWKQADTLGQSQKMYSENEIKTIKMKKSLEFSRSINTSILFDGALKGILILGMFVLILFYRNDAALVAVLSVIIGVSFFLLYKEFNIRNELLNIEDYAHELGVVLKRKIQFYKVNFPKLKWMIAFSNSLFVWVGSMFYFYSKYGHYRIEDFVDALVTILMITFAFGISYLALTFQFKLSVLDLEESLINLDDQEAASININAQVQRKKKFRIAMIIAIILGLALFLFLLLSYIN